MPNQDYGLILCEAIDTVVTERLKGLAYDQTILCIIEDNSKRDTGIYTVKYNNVKFDVYSDNIEYNKNDNVYVQIPKGDWDQHKFIIGKKTNTSNNEAYVYNNPFSTLVDITGNLIEVNIPDNETGLIANSEEQTIELWTYNNDGGLYNQTGEILNDYTRLGIQAAFQSWLNPFTITNGDNEITSRVIEGEYGLRLIIEAELENKNNSSLYILELNSNDMNGNPYDFNTFFQQEKVFDISQFKNIKSMSLSFYQKTASFKDKDGNLLPHLDYFGNSVAPNLFVSDIYICAGYDTSEFTDEMIKVFTLDSISYSEDNTIENNIKKIGLRWIHKQEDGSFKSIVLNDNLNFDLYWYRYKLGNPSADEYSGVYWKYLLKQLWNEEENTYNYSIEDEDWIKYNESKNEEEKINPSYFTSYLFPYNNTAEERIKAVLIYDGKILQSNVLTFFNCKEVVSDATLDAINSVNALQIHCSDGTFGNYRIYGDNNYLVNNGDAGIERKFVTYFSEDPEATPAILTEAEKITWTIPAKNTMIKIADSAITSEDGNYYIITHEQDENGYIINEQSYYINRYYSPSLVNNTIQCEIIKNGRTYKTSKELSFGVMGTTGTTCTLVLDFEHPGQNGIQINNDAQVDQIKNYTIVANLYDADNKNITNEALDKTWSWGWYGGSTGDIAIDSNDKNKCILEKNITSINGEQWNILQCTLKGWGDFELTAYLPIPLKWEIIDTCVPLYLEGTDIIVYNTEGLADYYKGSYKLIDVDNTSQSNFAWEINKSEEDDPFGPKLTKNNAIQASNVYIEDSTKGFVVNCKYGNTIVWSQPLLIIQNRYPNSTINQWDGKFKVNEDGNELLAARIAAGVKDESNTFTGVAIGDWQFDTNDKKTGIYGFHQGAMSYAFKDDGTAFIGKDGKGRIIFKGESGDIYSGTWEKYGLGMFLDINRGAIQLSSAKETEESTDDNPIFEIDESTGSVIDPKYIDIDVRAKEYPLAIGTGEVNDRNFRVNWDGKLFVTDGNFEGKINATSGSIGAWKILAEDENNFLSGALVGEVTNPVYCKYTTIYLDPKQGLISGGMIQAQYFNGGQFNTTNGGTIINGYFTFPKAEDGSTGSFGIVPANTGDSVTDAGSNGLGIQLITNEGQKNNIKVTSASTGITYGSSNLSITDSSYQIYNNQGIMYITSRKSTDEFGINTGTIKFQAGEIDFTGATIKGLSTIESTVYAILA